MLRAIRWGRTNGVARMLGQPGSRVLPKPWSMADAKTMVGCRRGRLDSVLPLLMPQRGMVQHLPVLSPLWNVGFYQRSKSLVVVALKQGAATGLQCPRTVKV